MSAENAAHTPTEGTAGLKLAGTAEGAATTKTGALEPTAEGEAGHGYDIPTRGTPTEGEHAPTRPHERRRLRACWLYGGEQTPASLEESRVRRKVRVEEVFSS